MARVNRRRGASLRPDAIFTSAAGLLLWGALVGPARADTVMLTPLKDNTLYQSATGGLSNGAGETLFSGRTGFFDGGQIRRALLAFDIAGSIPAGSEISSVTLRLSLSKTAIDTGAQPFSLHRVTADWGEGTSDPPFSEGGGAAATTGDATWLHRFFNTQFWSTQGGDFTPGASATRFADGIGLYTWGSTATLVADVQGWLDDPATNFGWILVGNEATFPTAKVFDSKDHPTAAARPLLTVEFLQSGGGGAGRVPDGKAVVGTPLTVERAGPEIVLRWGASCLASDDDYEIYEGVIGDFTSHAPRACSTGGALEWSLTPLGGDTYYLVVPRNVSQEGSYGADGQGDERQPGVAACLSQAIACP